MQSRLAQASISNLLAELLHDGEAKNIPELLDLEPISIGDIVRVLRDKTGKDFGNDALSWLAWYMDRKRLKTEKGQIEFDQLLHQIFRRMEYHVQRLKERKSKGQ